MKAMKFKLLGIAVFATVLSSSAQGLDLETCLRMADTANLTIRNSQLDVTINDRERSAYMSARLPHLAFSGDYKYNAIIPGQVVPGEFFGGPPGTFSTVQFGVPYNLSNTLQLTQVLYNPQVNYGLTALKINAEIVDIQRRMTEQDVKQQVASTYFNLQAINKQLAFVEGNLSNMSKLITNMQAMVDQDLLIQTEVDKLEINRLTLVNTNQSLLASKQQLETYLKILIGMDVNSPISLAADNLVEKSILVDNSTIVYTEMEMLAAQEKMNKEERKGTNMAYLPNLSFYASYNYNYNMKPEDDYRVGIEGAFIGLRLDWTLFDGLEKFHKQKANAINAEKIQNQQALAQQQLDMKAANAKRQIEVQANALTVSKEQLRLSERVYDQAKLKYEQGTISSNDLIDADNGLQQAQTNVVASYIQLRQAELEYLRSIGSIK
jgi:outer membrane protein TolC